MSLSCDPEKMQRYLETGASLSRGETAVSGVERERLDANATEFSRCD